MESRAETAVKSEIIFYTTKRGLESADRNEIRMFATVKKLHNHNRICLRLWCAFSIEHSVNCVKYKPEFNLWTAACRGVTDFRRLCQLHANKVYRNIKNRTVCFQERFRLLSLATVLRKYPSWFQNLIDIVFWNRNVYFLRTGRSQNPENKSVLFFIKPRLCGMQWFKAVKSANTD